MVQIAAPSAISGVGVKVRTRRSIEAPVHMTRELGQHDSMNQAGGHGRIRFLRHRRQNLHNHRFLSLAGGDQNRRSSGSHDAHIIG
jgi:hypothetical protein